MKMSWFLNTCQSPLPVWQCVTLTLQGKQWKVGTKEEPGPPYLGFVRQQQGSCVQLRRPHFNPSTSKPESLQRDPRVDS